MTEISNPQLAAAEELGRLLRHNREQQQLSIGDVSEHLKLPARQVEALENADFDKLPEPVFVRGFLRSYGRYLNLDEEVLNNYLEQLVRADPALRPAAKADAGEVKMTYHNARLRKPFPRWVFGVAAAVAIVGAVYLWQGKSKTEHERQNAQTSIPENQVLPPNLNGSSVQVLPLQDASAPSASAPAISGSQPLPAENASAASAPAAGIQSAAGELVIKLRFRSFLTVTDKDGQMLVSKIVPAGSEHRFSGNGPYRVRIGFAKNSLASYSGRDINVADHMVDRKTAAFTAGAPDAAAQ
ncbi:hypothetical protein A7P95_03050 [Eikenella longinqua]|uniref:Cytoskeleton protein RodZ-like C-terminal domain-containing protein n=1 Tax=Eikenella longinqua TaxID=1795827 RepID=A0A1A9RZI4_9NEIS|nr:helix-turn-helix domain-containing protein [Eikenella longinqua]OAM30014.1 hypothetical protein A7P95_03050 [Eikenella longinqua]